MNRVVGLETEYGCLAPRVQDGEPWTARVRNHAFRKDLLGLLDVHYRDFEEPPGNGGFLLNGGRLYMDMGHLEYSTPECRKLWDAVAYDVAGEQMLNRALEELEVVEQVGFLKNNLDYHTGATFGCHENYLLPRQFQLGTHSLGCLLSFLATRQLFAGTGRIGQAIPIPFEPFASQPKVPFQLSQRADYIVSGLYHWVQFNRAIINARDEPLADPRRFRRLHLLIGDSNLSPYATALKLGTTCLILTLLEEESYPTDVLLRDPVLATRQVSQAGNPHGLVRLEDGRTREALDIQEQFLQCAQTHLQGRDSESDWILQNWASCLQALRSDPYSLIGAVDWISKKWLLETFQASEGLAWDDPWFLSLDLEFHNIHPARGLSFGLLTQPAIAEFNRSVRRPEALFEPPQDTRAKGRGMAVQRILEESTNYIINWDSISLGLSTSLPMPDPLYTYESEVARLHIPTKPA